MVAGPLADVEGEPKRIKRTFSYLPTLVGKDRLEGVSQFVLCDLQLKCPAPGPSRAKATGVRLAIQPVTKP